MKICLKIKTAALSIEIKMLMLGFRRLAGADTESSQLICMTEFNYCFLIETNDGEHFQPWPRSSDPRFAQQSAVQSANQNKNKLRCSAQLRSQNRYYGL